MNTNNQTAATVINVLAAKGFKATVGDGEELRPVLNGCRKVGFDVEGWDGTQEMADEFAYSLKAVGFNAFSGDADNASEWPVYALVLP